MGCQVEVTETVVEALDPTVSTRAPAVPELETIGTELRARPSAVLPHPRRAG
jgi:hypothetical protein